jgi:hypothetical protein
MRSVLAAFLVAIALPALAGAGPDPDKSGAGRDNETASAERSERASLSPKLTHVIPPAPDNGVTDAELEENDRRANDPNYEPDPNDPISCDSDCAIP